MVICTLYVEVEVNELWYDVDEGSVDLHATRMHVVIRNPERLNQTGAFEARLSRVIMQPLKQTQSR